MPTSDQASDIISKYIKHEKYTNRDEVINALAHPIEDAFVQNHNVKSAEEQLWELWSAFLTEARSTDASDEAKQSELVALIHGLKRRGELQDEERNVCKIMGDKLWTDLPVLGLAARESWNKGPRKSSKEQWANVNAFIARVTTDDIFDFELYSIWVLRDALEYDRPLTKKHSSGDNEKPPTKPDERIDQLLPAALQWFLIYGAEMKRHGQEGKTYQKLGHSNDPAALGTLASEAGVESGGFNSQRWKFWHDRLSELEQTEGDDDDDDYDVRQVRRIAHDALEKIQSLDK